MPYMEISEYTKGDLTLNMLVDHSKSFEIFDRSQIDNLREKILVI